MTIPSTELRDKIKTNNEKAIAVFFKEGWIMLKKLALLLLLGCTICLVLMLSTSCQKNDPENINVFKITFLVDGREYFTLAEEGEIPVFSGSTEKASDDTYSYEFVGWTPALVPATEDATYEAVFQPALLEYTRCTFQSASGKQSFWVRNGEMPIAPAVSDYETDTDVYLFLGWSSEIVPADGTAQEYKALYDKTPKVLQVSFYSGNELICTTDCRFGEKPVYPGTEEPTKPDLIFIGWTNAEEGIRMNTDCYAIFCNDDPENVSWALKKELLAYEEETTDNGPAMERASALLALLLDIRKGHAEDLTPLAERAAAHLKNLTSGGKEPLFSLNCYWNYPLLAAGITLAHETPAVWNLLNNREKTALDLMMKSFAYIVTLGTADGNSYLTGPDLIGNYSKAWNPNYRLATVLPILFVSRYFGGADQVNEMLLQFDFDTHVQGLLDCGLTRAYACWTTPGPIDEDGKTYPCARDFMMNGGPAYLRGAVNQDAEERLGYYVGKEAGTGVGVRIEYFYSGHPLSDVSGILHELISYNYSGGYVINSYGEYPDGSPKAYIVDGTDSPVLGLEGMMLELKSGDGGNGKDGTDIRSSCGYCTHDFVILVSTLASLDDLGIYDITAPGNKQDFKLMWVGNTDFLYKMKHGYQSYSLGHPYDYINYDEDRDGYYVWKAWWQTRFADLSYSDIQ